MWDTLESLPLSLLSFLLTDILQQRTEHSPDIAEFQQSFSTPHPTSADVLTKSVIGVAEAHCRRSAAHHQQPRH